MDRDAVLAQALIGAVIVSIDDRRDEDGWLILHLESGQQVHLAIETGTAAVVVDPEPQ
jgi:archaeosine-15-forming tRNA-guanine transglycosylase